MAPESFWENLRRFFSEIKSLKEEEKLLEKSVSQKTGSPQVKKRVEDLIFAILELKDGNLAIKILNYFLENPRIFLPESEFFKLFPESKLAILHLLRFGILEKKFIAGEKEQGYSLSRETFNEVSIFKEIIREYRLLELIKLSSVEAKEEFKIILAKEGAFHQKVKEILDQNLESIINFGKNLKFEEIVEYFKKTFGEDFFHFYLFSFLQQISLTKTEIVDSYGNKILDTFFNLIFWEAKETNILESLSQFLLGGGIFPAHGINEIIKKWEQKSISNFLKISEAFDHKNFLFILPPLEYWIEKKDFLQTLLSKQLISVKIQNLKIGPYSLENCLFLGKLNIEKLSPQERSFWFSFFDKESYVNLELLFLERCENFIKFQREIKNFPPSFNFPEIFKDFLRFLFAIQREYYLLKDRFPKKKIKIKEDFLNEVEKITQEFLTQNDIEYLEAFESLKSTLVKLIATATLFEYFKQDFMLREEPVLHFSEPATRFFFEWYKKELKIRSQILAGK